MSAWTNIRDRLVRRALEWLGVDYDDIVQTVSPNPAPAKADAAPAPAGAESPAAVSGGSRDPARWDECSLASCWGGANASKRMMNVLSPKMPEATFRDYVGWMKGQGANTAHVFLINKGDGEYSGYSPWGTGVGPGAGEPSQRTVQLMSGRIDYLLAQGLAVVVWLMADDSKDWAAALAKNATLCLRWIADDGLLGGVSTVVLGLEMDEYWSSSEAKAVAAATRKVWDGKIGTHHTGGKATFVSLGDILFYQVDPGRSAAQIKSDTAAALKHGKPVNFFELDRGPNKTLAQAALDAGAFGVGNCAPGMVVKVREAKEAEPAPAKSGGIDPATLDWRYGGFDGSKAAEDPNCRILSASHSAKGATFKFSGSFWGATHADPTMRCCAFYESGGKWIGGFWEWGSPDRTYRGYENITDKYKGWDAAAWNAAKRRAFCICSKDGKKRTNLIEA
jgi:hypothetical protein